MNARELLARSLDNPVLIDRIGDDDDLLAAGVNSGEVIRFTLACEEALGRALSDDETGAINSLRSVEDLLRKEGAGDVA